MKLLGAFIAWVLIMFIEIMWLLVESSGVGSNEEIYVIIVVSLVVGATGLNLYSKNLKK